MPEQDIGGKCTLATDCKGWGWVGGRGVMCFGGECGEPGIREWDESKKGVPKGGETCNLHEDCRGYGLGLTDTACCGYRCKKKINGACDGEFGNVGMAKGGPCYTATDCKGWGHGIGGVGMMCKGGVCAEPGPEDIGGPCNLHEDCKGYGTGSTDTACCKFRCEKKIKSWCPGEGGNAGNSVGSGCTIDEDCANYGWGIGGEGVQCLASKCTPAGKQDEGGNCNIGAHCKGFGLGEKDMACCDNKCRRKTNWWCPNAGANAGNEIGGNCSGDMDCKNWGWGLGGRGITCYGGVCAEPGPRGDGETCTSHTDCLNWGPDLNAMACCENICTQKEKGACPGFLDGLNPFSGGFFAKIKRYLIIAAVAIGLFAMIGAFVKVGMLMGLSKKILAGVSAISFIIACVIIIIVVIATKPKEEEETYNDRQPVPQSSLSSLSKFNSNPKNKPLQTNWLELKPTNIISKRPSFQSSEII